jgi:hypothetical protein
MKCKGVKIYGVSHIVHSTENLDDAESNFIRLGYSRKSENIGSLNPPQKSPFISGNMSEKSDILLMSKTGYPDIEVKSESGYKNAIGESAFESFYDDKYNICTDINNVNPIAIYIKCNDIERAASLWSNFGFTINRHKNKSLLDVEIKNRVLGKKASLLYVNHHKNPEKTWLNQNNTVCLSFVCDSVEKVRDCLLEKGYYAGNIFKIKPFERKIKGFFMRNYTGEIYEFISPDFE